MDYAARNGHVDVVKWLHENRTEGCTTNAMDDASYNGHVDVVKIKRETTFRSITCIYRITHNSCEIISSRKTILWSNSTLYWEAFQSDPAVFTF
jgi:hypothetical protein